MMYILIRKSTITSELRKSAMKQLLEKKKTLNMPVVEMMD
ncbi:unknown [Clostridium sp. CAG:451]|nr:unknown [Clostridium sp. CAG:451]